MRPHFASPELMNWSMTTCAPLAKSPNCASQIDERVGLGGRVAVLEAEHRFFGQHRVDDHEVALVLARCAAAGCSCPRPTLAVLVVQHRVAMEERAAADVLAREAHAVAVVEQRRVGERLGHAPVERQLALAPSAARSAMHLRHARMQLEASAAPSVTRFGRALAAVASGTRVSHGVGPVAARERRPVDRELAA